MKRHAQTKFGKQPRPELIPGSKPEKRPVHKENLRLARKERDLNQKHPEPMSLMRKREREIDSLLRLNDGTFMPYRKPSVTLGMIEKAASAVAAWENSDPFSYGRTALHVRQGYIQPDVVIKEMSMRTIARRAAKIKEVDDAKAPEAHT